MLPNEPENSTIAVSSPRVRSIENIRYCLYKRKKNSLLGFNENFLRYFYAFKKEKNEKYEKYDKFCKYDET